MQQTYTVGNYLLDRLSELGIRHMFGVPGDYNLAFLDTVLEDGKMEWIGNANELNAAYAADGYGRINGAGALVTTFGVGELSAVNGIAGAYAERVPVVKITGTPTTAVMNNGSLVHHTLGDGKFDRFARMYEEVTVAQTTLTEENAAQEIDRVLQTCWMEKRPVHINLPIDVYNKPVNRPASPLNLSFEGNAEVLDEMIQEITREANEATQPVILADYEVDRFGAREALIHFAEKTGYPVATLSMGKGVFPESHPQFIGVYNGELSSPDVQKRVDEADVIFQIGVKLSDSITGGFSHQFTEEQVVEINPYGVKRKEAKYAPISMIQAMDELAARLDLYEGETEQTRAEEEQVSSSSNEITQKWFYERMAQFLKKNDVLLAEQGTSFFGAATMPLPEGTRFIGQPLWGSIGYTLPALLGSQLADTERRNLLFIGDGSFQLTAQELSTIMRHRLKPIIFLINNDGYRVERAIHGPEQVYNDIATWDYQKLPHAFGSEEHFTTFKAGTEEELDQVLANTNAENEKLCFIEVVMHRDDTPELLSKLTKKFAAQNN
ncbi:alpha-keto acid decarboxylase family protein [Guptibacillus hwajinpoensis]|uniref:alpha-keto acid decarboxylase family protein n=1 Tax=Guptibacillus hwajinpoensis TaxID=208199 RepID=UPI003CFC93F5